MSAVSAQIVIRFASAALGPETPEALLKRVGLSPGLDPAAALVQGIDAEAYYELLERAAGDDDHALPIRYAESVRPEDFGALGLALKTATSIREALERLVRHICVLTDSLAYALRESTLTMHGRSHHRRGARIANEGALAAITSLLRQISDDSVRPSAVSFRHAPTPMLDAHRAFFRCPLHFGAEHDALLFDEPTLAIEPPLGDEGLSAFLLGQLESVRAQLEDRTLEARVHRAITDALCDGPPSREQIARRMGMSERTLQRRLADEGLTFRDVANRARREVAQSLLTLPDHTLAEVAFLTGFSDQSAFHRAFKRWSGQTPQEFRAAAQR